MDTIIELLPLIIPIVLLEVAMRVYAILDLFKAERHVKLLGKNAWLVIILLINFGWVVYLLGGREA
ncbi:MAG: transcriptional regulator [Acholeplasmatales bacterium]|nr:MAG: transcriptional regulator [Acholeplasmatales bacterium]